MLRMKCPWRLVKKTRLAVNGRFLYTTGIVHFELGTCLCRFELVLFCKHFLPFHLACDQYYSNPHGNYHHHIANNFDLSKLVLEPSRSSVLPSQHHLFVWRGSSCTWCSLWLQSEEFGICTMFNEIRLQLACWLVIVKSNRNPLFCLISEQGAKDNMETMCSGISFHCVWHLRTLSLMTAADDSCLMAVVISSLLVMSTAEWCLNSYWSGSQIGSEA